MTSEADSVDGALGSAPHAKGSERVAPRGMARNEQDRGLRCAPPAQRSQPCACFGILSVEPHRLLTACKDCSMLTFS